MTRSLLHAVPLLCLSLSAQPPDFTPPNPLFAALMKNDTAKVEELLRSPSTNPNEGRFPMIGAPALFVPIVQRNEATFRALLEAGADVKVRDKAGNTLLMWAAASEVDSPSIVEELLRRGVDPQARNQAGETAFDWALQRGSFRILSALERAGASPRHRVQSAVESALAALQKSGPSFVKVSGCASCHHQSLPQLAIGAARVRGLAHDAESARQQVKAVIAMYKPLQAMMNAGSSALPDTPITVGYALLGLAAEHYPADDTTRAMAHVIAAQQAADGHFPSIPARPPMESSDISATALAIRALQLYGADPAPAIQRAQRWLRNAAAQTQEEMAMRLLGLAWSQAPAREVSAAADALLRTQRSDGGWAQLPTLESDAYATGLSLAALHLSGQANADAEPYRRGVYFLLRTQFADGTWLVRTRSAPLQVLRDSGFPHGRHQWSSASGSSWAALALAFALPTDHPETSNSVN